MDITLGNHLRKGLHPDADDYMAEVSVPLGFYLEILRAEVRRQFADMAKAEGLNSPLTDMLRSQFNNEIKQVKDLQGLKDLIVKWTPYETRNAWFATL